MVSLESFRSLTHRIAALAASLVMLLAAGCEQAPPVTTYEIPTEMPEELEPGRDRMLAAMVPHGESTWFFKVLGPQEAVDSIEPAFREFVENVEFDEQGSPELEPLPDNWRRGPDKPMRFASIDINTPQKQLDLSVSKLTRQEDWDSEVAMNVNRWRGQVGLDSSDEKWAGAEPLDVAAADGPAVWVDLTGRSADGGPSMMAPFAGRGGGGAGAPPFAAAPSDDDRPSPPTNAPESESASSRLTYDLPEGWRLGRKSIMRWAAFDVGPEDSPAEVTVIPAGGDVRGNVARWLGQIRGGTVPDEVVDEALAEAESLQVDGRPSQRFLLKPAEGETGTAIDATIIPLENDRSLFVKMTGPLEVVTQESKAMRSFLQSLKL